MTANRAIRRLAAANTRLRKRIAQLESDINAVYENADYQVAAAYETAEKARRQARDAEYESEEAGRRQRDKEYALEGALHDLERARDWHNDWEEQRALRRVKEINDRGW